ncbi:L-ascorbate oxidase-like protein [Hibiscus syriacus]|uniref:L-ascorbate oxidase-like protein n=1 Tax=Hibiscus syriacus TaxID=106335 RepID=A0A6A2XTK5_HIBSY|nr:U3 small nucleolar RNA-associated protein 6 homolog [Hibiscus syriacus]KAE8670175.1 L-ascorbate oxidase-like protein [Hibiscus syriacus]
MADVVQYRLERMVDELDDLERRGIFTCREIAEIVKQRRKFEYRLKRPSPLKQDFIAYIDYETQLDSLRRLRKKAATRELVRQGKKIKSRKSVSDFAPVARIMEIYRLAVMRYKGDVELWFRYLEFCRQRNNGRMKKVLAQVIRFHPKLPGVWIYAAAWEFDHNLNVAAARALMQSGLRLCPNSEDLWVEYLRMELTYLNKLKARKAALGEDKGTLVRDKKDADEKQWKEENKDLFMSLDDEEKENIDHGSDEESGKESNLFLEHASGILKTIYSGAIQAVPSSFSLRKQLLEILEAIEVADSEELRGEILSDMKRDFSADPEYWDWLARLEMSDASSTGEKNDDAMLSKLQKAAQVYEEAIKSVPSATMFKFYIKFLSDVIAPKSGEAEVISLTNHTSSYITDIMKVYEKAEKMGCLTEELACQYISFYTQLGRLEEAKKLAEKLCCGKLSDSLQLWVLRVSIEIRCITRNSLSPCKADALYIFELFRTVLTKMSMSEAESLWIMALKFFGIQKKYFEKLIELSLRAVAKYGGSENGFSLSSAVVNFILQKDGLKHAREVYKRFLALPHPGLALYKNCIELESNLASLGNEDSLENARKLYEAALKTYDQDTSLWKDYHSLETKLGTSETAAAIYWRARKSLKESAVVF